MMRRRPVPRAWREEHHDLDLHARREFDFRGTPKRSQAGGVCTCGARFGTRAEPARHNMNAADVREAWLDHVEAAYYERAGTIAVGERCPGCGVICASLDVEHLDDCPFQGSNALRLVEPCRCVYPDKCFCPPEAKRRAATAARDDAGDFLSDARLRVLDPHAGASRLTVE